MNLDCNVIVFPGQERITREILGLPHLSRDIDAFERWQNTPEEDERYNTTHVALIVSQFRAASA